MAKLVEFKFILDGVEVVINQKQKVYVEQYLKNGGMSLQAYNYAYGKENLNDRKSESRACTMKGNDKVGLYFQYLNEQILDEQILSIKDRKALLSDIAMNSDSKDADKIRSIDALNKMERVYEERIVPKKENNVIELD